MAQTTRRSFLTAAAGFAASATPALAGMRPIYGEGDDPLSGYSYEHSPVPATWTTRVEYHPLAEVQPVTVQAPAPAAHFLVPEPRRKPLRVDMSYEDSREHRLKLRIPRTGETFDDVFRAGPIIYDDALGEIDHLLRDWRRDEVIKIDRGLIELLSMVQEEIGFENPITVISGYRSPATNRMLRRKMRGVAKNSYHTRGMAADIRLPGVSPDRLRKLAQRMHAGGVGYYPSAGFVHLDTGPVRNWRA